MHIRPLQHVASANSLTNKPVYHRSWTSGISPGPGKMEALISMSAKRAYA